jgi:hypothetical protein
MIELFEPRVAPATFIVTNLADAGEGSLREAIADASACTGFELIAFRSARADETAQ